MEGYIGYKIDGDVLFGLKCMMEDGGKVGLVYVEVEGNKELEFKGFEVKIGVNCFSVPISLVGERVEG